MKCTNCDLCHIAGSLFRLEFVGASLLAHLSVTRESSGAGTVPNPINLSTRLNLFMHSAIAFMRIHSGRSVGNAYVEAWRRFSFSIGDGPVPIAGLKIIPGTTRKDWGGR